MAYTEQILRSNTTFMKGSHMHNVFKIEDYPGIKAAYPFAVESYQWAIKRFDAIDSRIQTTLGFGMTFTLAVPAIFSALGIKPQPEWFIAAMILFVSACTVGITAQMKGKLTIVTPKALYNQWLHFSELEFQKNLIFFSGQHLDTNLDLIALKQRLLVFATIIFSLEILCLVASVACQY
jgi:hypothetical protein